MNRMGKMICTGALCAAASAFAADFHEWARTPPMGWNSWDCFGTTVTEAQVKEQADAQAKLLKPYGWTLLTVDITWYHGGSKGHVYEKGAELTMDEYGRLTPALEKFPSAADGAGFKPLADYVHSKGLTFGIHIMRGIARQAVERNTPIFGTNLRARDIALTDNICVWNPHMYGVDMTKPGAQEYYDSLFAMYAAWGVDFVKVDDISRPYDEIQQREIEAIRKAIDKTGRPIVLSLSPGDTPVEKGSHVNRFANMWRVSDDFWDRWDPLFGMFGRLHKWTPYRIEGSWPDADMLPFGIIDFNRPTNFTPDEQRTCMTLWCIARSPLILGADMTRMDADTLKLLTNREVLAVNQASSGNRQISRDSDDRIVWAADAPDGKDKYVALFNAGTPGLKEYDLQKAAYRSILVGKSGVRDVDIKADVKGSKQLALVVTDGGDSFNYDHAGWIDPVLRGPAGELKLSDLKWKTARTGYGETRVGLTTNGEKMNGIGTHAPSVILYDLPEGYETFEAKGRLMDGCEDHGGSVEFLVLTDKAFQTSIPPESEVSVSFDDLGVKGPARVRDLWEGKDLGVFENSFSRVLKCHASGLYRISPVEK